MNVFPPIFILSWQAARYLIACSFDIHAHTHTHVSCVHTQARASRRARPRATWHLHKYACPLRHSSRTACTICIIDKRRVFVCVTVSECTRSLTLCGPKQGVPRGAAIIVALVPILSVWRQSHCIFECVFWHTKTFGQDGTPYRMRSRALYAADSRGQTTLAVALHRTGSNWFGQTAHSIHYAKRINARAYACTDGIEMHLVDMAKPKPNWCFP